MTIDLVYDGIAIFIGFYGICLLIGAGAGIITNIREDLARREDRKGEPPVRIRMRVGE